LLSKIKMLEPQSLTEKAEKIFITLTPYMVKKSPKSCKVLVGFVKDFYKQAGVKIPYEVLQKEEEINNVIKGLEKNVNGKIKEEIEWEIEKEKAVSDVWKSSFKYEKKGNES